MICELCGCEDVYDFHHLIPRCLHKKKWFKKRYTKDEMNFGINVCKCCHKTIHRLIPDNKDLGKLFNTLRLLRSQPDIAKYIDWKRKRDIEEI